MNPFITIYKSIFYFLFFFLCQTISSQNFTHEFGKYGNEEFQLKKYDKDPSAEAVVIYDIGESFFTSNDEGFEIIFERRVKYKIFNKAGLHWAQFEIPYYLGDNGYEKVYDLEGNTYNFENGQLRKSKLNAKNVFEEKKDEHWYRKKFAMPDVKEGSVIEIIYKISSPYIFNFRSWEFQQEIPVIYSEYKTRMVPFYLYSYILQGINKFDSFKSYEHPGFSQQFAGVNYKEMDYEFIMRDIPAFKDEGFVTSANDYIIRLDFQLAEVHRPGGAVIKYMTTWPKVIEEYLDNENFGKYLKSSVKSGKEIADTMKVASRSTLDKVRILDRYIKNNFNWNGKKSEFASKSVKDFIKTKSGNSAEINLYLSGLLQAVGVEAYPVIISTRDHGKIRVDYPFVHYFNYVIIVAQVDKDLVILDATEPLCNFKEIPIRSRNDIGLIINKAKTEWLTFNNTQPSTIADSIDLRFNATVDSLKAKFNVDANSYDALNLRRLWIGNNKIKIKDELNMTSINLDDSIKDNNLTQIEKSFGLSFESNTGVERIDNKLLVAPFCGAVVSENPFRQLTRSYAIDMIYKKRRDYVAILHIPDGYKLLTQPDKMELKNIIIEMSYSTEQIDSKTIKIKAYYEFKKEIYDSSDYGYLKAMYNKIINKFNDKIILVKN